MRIGMLQLALGEQGTGKSQLPDDADVRGALLAVRRNDCLAAEQRERDTEGAVRFDVMGHRQTKFQAHLVVVVAMRRGSMDKPGACVISYVIAGKQGNVIVPLTRATGNRAKRVGQDHVGQIRRHAADFAGKPGDLGLCQRRLGQFVGQDQTLAHRRYRAFGHAIDTVDAIINGRVERHRAVLRDGPRRRGPDHDFGAGQV